MCGIIGIFGPSPSEKQAEYALSKIIHRGTSFFELRTFSRGILGANRLPIVDREAGIQPQKGCGEIYAAQNGEIFNYLELRKDLIAKGHTFKTCSDTEVLAHLYETYGPDMVAKLDSEMFAFIVYDSENQSLLVARDPLGVKPLYYAKDNQENLYFASELKQLSSIKEIEQIHEFPSGHYFHNGEFTKYFNLQVSDTIKDEQDAKALVRSAITAAVKKRVQTDLPIGVFLSGGVDSSLIMELAHRNHPDVTALILGYHDSPDYEFAMRLCKERGYKYHVVRPDVDYEEELDDLLYYLESYEPLVVRQAFSNNIISRAAQRLGLKMALVGEGADELFAGYNEFAFLPSNLINKGSLMITESLSRGHLQRVDRMAMRYTLETRSPFFDTDLVRIAMEIDGDLKVKRDNHQITTKYILRQVASEFLPDYIAWRYKMPFANGAGMNVGYNYKAEDGDVAKVANKRSANLPGDLQEQYGATTKESQYYLSKFHEYDFTKLVDADKRLVVKDNLNELYASANQRLLVGEFDRLALYFPVYFAEEKGFFDLHHLEVDFISTGGDDRTYNSLVRNTAHIGLADPMFAMIENEQDAKGEIIGDLVAHVPNVAVSINPKVSIQSLEDFSKYKVGSFEQFSTTHSLAKAILPENANILPFPHNDLLEKLRQGVIDVAITLPEQANEIVAEGGKIDFDFSTTYPNFLFTGFTVASTLEPKYRDSLKSFMVAIRDTVRHIHKNPEEALGMFKDMFPDLKNPKATFNTYLSLWTKNTQVDNIAYRNSYNVWKKNYPHLLKTYSPYFYNFSEADSVIAKMNSTRFRREFPFMEDELEKVTLASIKEKQPLKLVGFWGVGAKKERNESDIIAAEYYQKFIESLSEVLPAGTETTWLLADSHGRNNGYEDETILNYLGSTEKLLTDKGFKTIYLSTLWKKWGLTHQSIEDKLHDPAFFNILEENQALRTKLENQSGKRFQGEDKVLGAKKYFLMRLLEKPHLEREFQGQVFFAYSDSVLKPIYPDLPTLYLYAQGPKQSLAPWFND